MMMSALEAGGMDLLVDDVRAPDENNPKGYYEYERVKKLPKGDRDWLDSARGQSVKVVSALLPYLPSDYQYRVIFMERDIEEILASQKRMLERTGKVDNHPISDEEMRQSYLEHVAEIMAWLAEKDWIQTLSLSYNELLCRPEENFNKVADLLDNIVDPKAMAQVVDPSLYRERS